MLRRFDVSNFLDLVEGSQYRFVQNGKKVNYIVTFLGVRITTLKGGSAIALRFKCNDNGEELSIMEGDLARVTMRLEATL